MATRMRACVIRDGSCAGTRRAALVLSPPSRGWRAKGAELFVHISALQSDGSLPKIGERVSYLLGTGQDGKPRAEQVFFGSTAVAGRRPTSAFCGQAGCDRGAAYASQGTPAPRLSTPQQLARQADPAAGAGRDLLHLLPLLPSRSRLRQPLLSVSRRRTAQTARRRRPPSSVSATVGSTAPR